MCVHGFESTYTTKHKHDSNATRRQTTTDDEDEDNVRVRNEGKRNLTLAEPPVEMTSYPNSARPSASSVMPVLSETEMRARGLAPLGEAEAR